MKKQCDKWYKVTNIHGDYVTVKAWDEESAITASRLAFFCCDKSKEVAKVEETTMMF